MIDFLNIFEARRNSVILVDFQPTYARYNPNNYDRALQNAMRYINEKQPQVTAYYNGEDVGCEESVEDIMWHFIEDGDLEEELADTINFKEKTYAFLRGWMDNGIDDRIIIKIIREMAMQRENDSRELDLETLLGDDYEDSMDVDNIYIPDIAINELHELSGSLIGGGGRDECLRELQILMSAFNIKAKMVEAWIYG